MSLSSRSLRHTYTALSLIPALSVTHPLLPKLWGHFSRSPVNASATPRFVLHPISQRSFSSAQNTRTTTTQFTRNYSNMSYSHPVEEELLQQILSQESTLKNNPQAILNAIDEFGQKNRIMNVGPHKGAYILDEIRKLKPETIFEFGTHTGYSSIMMAAELEKLGLYDSKIHTFDIDPGFSKISSQIIKLAGLSHRIEQHLGKASDTVEPVSKELGLDKVDMVFLDHAKDFYVHDLRILESLGLINKGTVICADNVITPGAPDYLEYVRNPPIWRKKFTEEHPSQYPGKWGLIYESEIHEALTGRGHKDGVEVSKCVGVLN